MKWFYRAVYRNPPEVRSHFTSIDRDNSCAIRSQVVRPADGGVNWHIWPKLLLDLWHCLTFIAGEWSSASRTHNSAFIYVGYLLPASSWVARLHPIDCHKSIRKEVLFMKNTYLYKDKTPTASASKQLVRIEHIHVAPNPLHIPSSPTHKQLACG